MKRDSVCFNRKIYADHRQFRYDKFLQNDSGDQQPVGKNFGGGQ